MVFLHPIYTVLFILLIGASFLEINYFKKKSSVFIWVIAVWLIIASGLRGFVGADYGVYRNLFSGFSMFTTYQDVFDKAIFRQTSEQIEWLYVLLNKIVFDAGFPFYVVTLAMAAMSVSLKLTTIYKNVNLPILGILLYFMPLYFFEDSGQIRQGLGVGICVFSFKYIKERNLKMYLLLMYLALGFHKTTVAFIPAYWLVKIPLNSYRIFILILVSILLSPFEIFRLAGGFFDTIAPQDISEGYVGYVDDSTHGASLGFGLTDLVKIFYIYLLIKYDKIACEKVYYYEYMRNLGVFGLCIFYVMRGNTIFAVRLPGSYMFYLNIFVVPSIIYAVQDNVKRIIHSGVILYLILLYFNFSKINGVKGNFTTSGYSNVLWR